MSVICVFENFCEFSGVPAAMISINVIEHLSKLLVSTAEQVRGSAAIALGYLSYNHTGERQLLNK